MPTLPHTDNPVTAVSAASPEDACSHFARLLALETDCWDVHLALSRGLGGFVVLDVRSPSSFARGHVPGAANLPHARISADTMAGIPPNTLVVVYCSGPHCNGADRAAHTLATLGWPVKKMIGGMTGWLDEGFGVTPADTSGGS